MVSATDPLTFALLALLLCAVALAAYYLPARRAAQVDRLVALRQQWDLSQNANPSPPHQSG